MLTIATLILATKFGVHFSGEGEAHDHPEFVIDAGASWVRLNATVDGTPADYTSFLAAGLNVVLTLVHRQPSNVNTQYGTLQQWPRAGFPYRSRSSYEQDVRDLLTPALPFLAAGRQLYVQCENEAGDVSFNPSSSYWRGTTDQYLEQLSSFAEAVRSLSGTIPVVMTSFASGSLEIVISPSDSRYTAVSARLSRMLTEGAYDAADLHLYDCAESIATKAQWVRTRLPAGRTWISTENGGPDPTCPSTPFSYDSDPALYEATEAQQVPLRLRSCSNAGGAICLWFSLFDLRQETAVFSHMGLLDQTSTPPRRKPAWDAFRSFVQTEAAPVRRRAARH